MGDTRGWGLSRLANTTTVYGAPLPVGQPQRSRWLSRLRLHGWCRRKDAAYACRIPDGRERYRRMGLQLARLWQRATHERCVVFAD